MSLKNKTLNKRIRLTSFQIISLAFFGLILLGAFLLSLPISNKSGQWTSFIDSLFTSASAVCVTGLVVFDTATYWTIFGQIVILILIQVGGMGIVTLVASFLMLSGKKIGLFVRGTVQDAVSSSRLGGVIEYVGFIVKGIFLMELIGALLLLPAFVKDYGAEGIWLAIFQSISAFCNAGFDIMGDKTGAFSSLTSYVGNPLVNLTICALVYVGGIGFVVWRDIVKHKFRLRRYSLQSKIALLVSLVLFVVPAIYFFFFEFENMPLGERFLASMFQSVTPRTAGFNTVDLTAISDAGLGLTIVLMLIGGSTGSTAGGMKTSTVAVLFASFIALFRKKDEPELLQRRVDVETIKRALTILIMYILLLVVAGMIISRVEDIPMKVSLFETASAIGTVGLSLGITPSLHTVSKLILIVCMYFGRVGVLTLFYATIGAKKKAISKCPYEDISIG